MSRFVPVDRQTDYLLPPSNPAEHQPLGEVIELLALVRRRVNRATQLRLVQVLQQEQRADDAAEFSLLA